MSATMPGGKANPMSEARPRLDFIIEHDGWTAIDRLQARCAAVIEYALSQLQDARPGITAVLLTDDESVQSLNARFRGKDKPTNVLSFPAPEAEGYPGDVALAFETCAAEAERDGKTLLDHATHLVLHGVLHLNGFDHIEEDEAEEMEALERDALKSVGIADPYNVRMEP